MCFHHRSSCVVVLVDATHVLDELNSVEHQTVLKINHSTNSFRRVPRYNVLEQN
jgi:hypothetical protein